MGQDHFWCQFQQFRSGGPRLLNVAWCPTIVHANATAARPAQLLHGALEHRSANLRFWIAFAQSHQHTDAPHPVRLLRARRKRPRRRAAEKAHELTSPQSAPKLRRQHCIGSNEYFDRAKTGHQKRCRSAQPMSLMGQNPNASRRLACQLSPAADKPPHGLYSAMCHFQT